MIKVENTFQENNLNIVFIEEDTDDKTVNIQIENDVNFQELIDLLLQFIHKKEKLDFSFGEIDEQEGNEKLQLIKDMLQEIYEKFNLGINGVNESQQSEEVGLSEADDLPF